MHTYDLRIPAVPGVAEPFGRHSHPETHWIAHEGMVFSRLREVRPTPTVPVVHDLEVDVDESYMTVAALAHNGGKRKGAVCAYLETWHIDIEEFLELRKNTGDERRRTHDMNTANWVPDEFLRRVEADGEWTLFSPDEVPGPARPLRRGVRRRATPSTRRRRARRDPGVPPGQGRRPVAADADHAVRDRAPVDHLQGPVQPALAAAARRRGALVEPVHRDHPEHRADEIAVCNLGSVNLVAHVTPDGLDAERLRDTVRTAVRMLDNVIDMNFYTIPPARRSNLRHRPVGLGLMGFADALFTLRIPYASDAAVEFADTSMEQCRYYAIEASSRPRRGARPVPVVRRFAVEPRASCRSTRWSCSRPLATAT